MDSAYLVVAALIGVFAVAGLALLAFAARRREPIAPRSLSAIGMAIGMLLGAALGTIVWMSNGEFVLWVICMGGGMVVGLGLGQRQPRGSPRREGRVQATRRPGRPR